MTDQPTPQHQNISLHAQQVEGDVPELVSRATQPFDMPAESQPQQPQQPQQPPTEPQPQQPATEQQPQS